MKKERYNRYSTYLKEKYGEKVYKIPINLPVTCPNRDGCTGEGGCIFCGEVGAGFETLENTLPVSEQLKRNIEYISGKYNARKYIAYFQNFTNTYMPPNNFRDYMIEAAKNESVVGICISTRPDCLNARYLDVLKEIKNIYELSITVELGLQTVNYKTLKVINRGHTLAEFIDSMIMINDYGFESCVHLIMNLPWDDMDDTIEAAKIISALDVKQVKLHSLYILKNTELGKMYEKGELNLISADEYVDRVITFLKYINPDIIIQRMVGRAPKEDSLFCNWNMSWWKIQDMIDNRLEEERIYQGMKYDYLKGKSVRKYIE